ncbi:MAG TPA: thioredoxin domain-containing protein [Candidatus Acidoferrum sp.]|nr:thioredoxin domain-containing protein [Candidatus Acidoferrum sp.]
MKKKQSVRTLNNQPKGSGWGTIAIGSTFLVIAIVASALLSAKHIWALTLPGCGQGAGCDWAISSRYSRVFGIPVAYLGFSLFAAQLTAWLLSIGRPVRRVWLIAAAIGGVVSVFYLGLMFTLGHVCVWCLTVHLSNLAWLGTLAIATRPGVVRELKLREIAVAGAVFFMLVVALKLLEINERSLAAKASQEAARRSIEQIGRPEGDSVESEKSIQSNTRPPAPSIHPPHDAAFGGRYWTGAKNAAVRLVIFQDYQCKLCHEVDSVVALLLVSRSDLALSVKQWPFDSDCNHQILGENIHPGACLDARYAEAAGLIGGDRLFWLIHDWLVREGGAATPAEVEREISNGGGDVVSFRNALGSPKLDSMISADIDEGIKYGIKYTPMVFVNGYEVQGWQTPGTISAAIDRAAQVAEQNPKPGDIPDPAIDRQFQQWLAQPAQTMSISRDDHVRGPLSAPVAILMYGDVSEPYNAEATRLIAAAAPDTQRICFIFRSFPLQSECNDMVKRPMNPHACEAARLLEAASLADGPTCFWRARQWFVDNASQLSAPYMAKLAAACHLSADVLQKKSSDSRVDTQIQANIASAKQLGIDTSPTIFVNGRMLRDWRTPGLLARVIQYAGKSVGIK